MSGLIRIGTRTATAGALTRWLIVCMLFLAAASGAQAQTTVRYVHTDALGSVVAMTDANRAVSERRNYEPYGQQLGAVSSGPGYTGHVQDPETGLTYMQQRYYDPQLGVFLSVDPVTAVGNNDWRHLNRYAYAYNNPLTYVDNDGRVPVLAVPAAIALRCAANAACRAGVSAAARKTVNLVGAVVVAAIAADGVRNNSVANESAESESQEIVDAIFEGTTPAAGKPGKDGVKIGQGGAEGAADKMDVVMSDDRTTVLVDNKDVTVVELPDGRRVESHTSTKGGQYAGDRTIKIQNAGTQVVEPGNIIRFPEPTP